MDETFQNFNQIIYYLRLSQITTRGAKIFLNRKRMWQTYDCFDNFQEFPPAGIFLLKRLSLKFF